MKLSPKAIIIPAIALFIIATIVAAALAGTNLLTADKIKQVEEENTKASCYTVLNLDSTDSKNSFGDEQTVTINADGKDQTITYYEGTSDGQNVGYAFIAPGPGGYGGTLSIAIGIDLDGNITGVYCLDIADETPGLGQNASGKFKDQFVGHNVSEAPLTVSKDGGTIDAMSGATITSRAVTKAVTYAMMAFKEVA